MTATVHWRSDAQQTLVYSYWDKCDVRDYYQMVNATYNLLEEIDSSAVNQIINLRVSSAFPVGMFSNMAYEHGKSQNEELLIFVGANRFLRSIIDAVDTVTPGRSRRVHYVNTLEDAYTLLEPEHNYESVPLLTH